MMRRIALCLVSLMLTAPAWAHDDKQHDKQNTPATGGSGMPVDWSKMGSASRKPTNEAKTKKEIEAFIKEEDAIMKKRDVDAALARVDFPVFMATDDSKGVPKAELFDRQQYSDMMKPITEQMPADTQVTHKPNITVLSDSLVVVNDEYTASSGGKKWNGRTSSLLVKKDGNWKWKAMTEAGWGDLQTPGVGGSGMFEEKQEKPTK